MEKQLPSLLEQMVFRAGLYRLASRSFLSGRRAVKKISRPPSLLESQSLGLFLYRLASRSFLSGRRAVKKIAVRQSERVKAQSQLPSLLGQMVFHAGLYRLAHNDRK